MDLTNTFHLPRFQASPGTSDLSHTWVKSVGFLRRLPGSQLQDQHLPVLFHKWLSLFLDFYITLRKTKTSS